MNKSEIATTRKQQSSDMNNIITRQLAQNEIDEQKDIYFAGGGKTTHLAAFGVVATSEVGYRGAVVPTVRKLNAKRKFYINARSCFSRSKKGAPIHVFKSDEGYHFRYRDNAGPEGAEFFMTFKDMNEVKRFKLPAEIEG